MVTGVEIGSALIALFGVLKSAINLATELRQVSVQSTNLSQQLSTLADVLGLTDREFKRTLRIVADSGADAAGLEVVSGLLAQCISDCTVVCTQYEALLSKISRSTFKAIQWTRAEKEFTRLHTTLEARKSTLLTLLTSIRQFANNHGHAVGFSSRPPPYTPTTNSPSILEEPLVLAAAGFLTTGASGAAIGAIAGPIGAAVGGVIGGIVGALGGATIGVERNRPPPRTRRCCRRHGRDSDLKSVGFWAGTKLRKGLRDDEWVCDGTGIRAAGTLTFLGAVGQGHHMGCRQNPYFVIEK